MTATTAGNGDELPGADLVDGTHGVLSQYVLACTAASFAERLMLKSYDRDRNCFRMPAGAALKIAAGLINSSFDEGTIAQLFAQAAAEMGTGDVMAEMRPREDHVPPRQGIRS